MSKSKKSVNFFSLINNVMKISNTEYAVCTTLNPNSLPSFSSGMNHHFHHFPDENDENDDSFSFRNSSYSTDEKKMVPSFS